MFLLGRQKDTSLLLEADNKAELIQQLRLHPTAIVILDYTLFDFSGAEEILTALQCASRKERFICNHVSNLLLAGNGSSSPTHSTIKDDLLTTAERSILKEIALGKTTKEIAAERNLSFHTVNSHRKNIFRKLGVNNAHEATKYAMKAGIVDLVEYYI